MVASACCQYAQTAALAGLVGMFGLTPLCSYALLSPWLILGVGCAAADVAAAALLSPLHVAAALAFACCALAATPWAVVPALGLGVA